MTEKHRNVPQGINYELQYTEKIMPMLVFNGYYHHFNGSRDTIEGQVYYWRCVKRAELGVDKCSGTASVKENPDKQWQAYAGRTQHNHEPNAIQASIRTFQHELRSEALNGAKATREVVKESVEKMPEYAKALVDPSPASKIVRKVRRKRKLETNIPLSEPKTLHEIQINDDMKYFKDKLIVYYNDFTGDDEYVLIMSSEKLLDNLAKFSHWGCDATFSIAPLLFRQLWIIYVKINHSYCPVVFCLMTTKSEKSYNMILSQLTLLRPQLKPTYVALDFEKAEHNAFKNAFPECSLNGLSNVTGNIGATSGENMLSNLRRITGVNVTATGTTIRITGVDVTAEGTKIRRKAPLFEKAIWNINAMILSEQPKTSNSIESFNKQLAKCIGHSHPSIYRLIPEIGAEILWAESKIGAYLAGGKFPRRNGRYVEVQKRLRNAVIRNTEVKSNNISFLKAIAMNLGRVDHRRSDPNSPEIQCMTKLNVVRRVLKLDMLDDDFLHQICIKHGYNQEKRAYEASFKYFSSTEAKPSRTWCVFGDGNCILRSVAVAVSGDEENHLAVRRDVGNYIIKHREKCNRARCWCRTYNIPNDLLLESAQNCGDRDRWGSTLHLIAASKLYKIVILTYSQLESGLPSWTVHNPSMQTGTAPSMEQELVYPSVAFQIEANHCDVVLDVEPPL
ncbi:MULE transposase domain-containing protein [Ditylenchus destructor]|uniref:MULE transposase domain-containing protein n=1 Tax=Ditylenchus destructor TaxID=166010 RepID=A0AAD4MYF2_9BILA|nr:MULE transposase domain-containing protein [Ditylenchus destructor]